MWLKNNESRGKFAYNDKHFYRGIYGKPQTFEIKFERNQNKKVSEYDKFLKKFQYKKYPIHNPEHCSPPSGRRI